MSASLAPLIVDFLEWLSHSPRTYLDVMDAWRTSCPRLTVWEDATEQGLVARVRNESGEQTIEVTPLGRDFIRRHRVRSDSDIKQPRDSLNSRMT